MKIKIDNSRMVLIILLFLLLFFYVLCRAYILGFTHDESLTFTIINNYSGQLKTANNHWLNTILTYLTAKFFGYSEIALRLPNVISFLIYCFFYYKITIDKKNSFATVILPLMFLFLNPFVLDFFSLSRGYGLALAFFSGSVFFILKLHDCLDTVTLVKGLIFSVVTVYANYSFLLPILCLHFCHLSLNFNMYRRLNIAKEHCISYMFGLVFLIPGVINILYLKEKKLLYFGGTENIINDTFFSLLNKTLHYKIIENQNTVIIILIFFLLLCGFKYRKNYRIFFILNVFICTVVLTVALNYFLGMKFPLERTALYYIFIIGVYFHYLLQNIFTEEKLFIICLFSSTITLICTLILVSFVLSSNLSFARDWKYDADTKLMTNILSTDVLEGEKISLGINWLFEPTINYYRIVDRLEYLNPVNRKGISGKEYDYYYVFNYETIDIACQQVLKKFEISRTKLVKNCRQR